MTPIGTLWRRSTRRVDRRARAFLAARAEGCALWRDCPSHHVGCANAVRADALLREACRLANGLALNDRR
jgi:hypothetical protein